MASIDSRGLVDDGTQNLSIGGQLSVSGMLTSSAGSFGVMATFNSNTAGQNLGSPNSFSKVNQWLTGSTSTAGVSLTTASGSMTINQSGWYYTSISMSFSGSTGTYTFSLFQNGVQHPNCQRQTTIGSGQSFPVGLALADLNLYNVGDVIDVRVACNNAGANFQLNNGNFIVFRVTG